jgi:uncharacterized repeat protein (TIGR03803 family)
MSGEPGGEGALPNDTPQNNLGDFLVMKFVLTVTMLALCSLSLAENPSANNQPEAAAAVAPAAKAKKFTALHVFTGTPDGAFSEAPLVQDADGNLYGTTLLGGGTDGTVFKVDKNGNEAILFNFFNTVSGAGNASGLLLDAAGNLYGVADEGPGGAGVLFRLDKNSDFEILHTFQGGFNNKAKVPAGGVIMDRAGNLYGATLAGGLGPFPGFGTVYRVDPTGKFTVLYSFQGKSDGANPQGPLVRDADGNLYGAATAVDSGGTIKGKIFKLAPDGTLTVLHTFMGGKDGSGPQGGLLMDNAGNLFGSAIKGGDSDKGTMFEITKSGKFKRLYSFTGGADGNSPNGGLVQDPEGNIYGTTQSGPCQFFLGTVYKLSPTHMLTVLHSFRGLEDGAIPLAGLIRDSAGNLYGTTSTNFLIRPVQGGGVFKIAP